jgi:competence protein ComGC
MIVKKKSLHAMTLLEIITVLGIIGIILFIAIPSWLRQREQTRGIACQETLTKIEHAKEMYIFDKNLKGGDPVDLSDLWQTDSKGYLKFKPRCPAGGQYTVNPVNVDPTCSFYGQEVFSGIAQHKLPQ